MYQSNEEVQPFLKFVFPDKIEIKYDENDVVPKFFTFMSTDAEGMVAFFHCLIYYEKYTLNDIFNDYDEGNERMLGVAEIIEKQRKESQMNSSHDIFTKQMNVKNAQGIFTANSIGVSNADDPLK